MTPCGDLLGGSCAGPVPRTPARLWICHRRTLSRSYRRGPSPSAAAGTFPPLPEPGHAPRSLPGPDQARGAGSGSAGAPGGRLSPGAGAGHGAAAREPRTRGCLERRGAARSAGEGRAERGGRRVGRRGSGAVRAVPCRVAGRPCRAERVRGRGAGGAGGGKPRWEQPARRLRQVALAASPGRLPRSPPPGPGSAAALSPPAPMLLSGAAAGSERGGGGGAGAGAAPQCVGTMARWLREHLGFRSAKPAPPAPPKPDYRAGPPPQPPPPPGGAAEPPPAAQPDILAAYRLQKERDFEDPYSGASPPAAPDGPRYVSPKHRLIKVEAAEKVPASPPPPLPPAAPSSPPAGPELPDEPPQEVSGLARAPRCSPPGDRPRGRGRGRDARVRLAGPSAPAVRSGAGTPGEGWDPRGGPSPASEVSPQQGPLCPGSTHMLVTRQQLLGWPRLVLQQLRREAGTIPSGKCCLPRCESVRPAGHLPPLPSCHFFAAKCLVLYRDEDLPAQEGPVQHGTLSGGL